MNMTIEPHNTNKTKPSPPVRDLKPKNSQFRQTLLANKPLKHRLNLGILRLINTHCAFQRGKKMARNINSTKYVTLVSWHTLIPAKPPSQNGSCTTQDAHTKSVKCTMVQPRWIGWNKNKNAVSPSPRRPPPVSGKTICSP